MENKCNYIPIAKLGPCRLSSQQPLVDNAFKLGVINLEKYDQLTSCVKMGYEIIFDDNAISVSF